MDVVKKIESFGTQSGKPKASIKIADCVLVEESWTNNKFKSWIELVNYFH